MDEHPGHTPASNSTEFRTDEGKILALTRFLCVQLGLPDYEVSLSFVSSKAMRGLNKEHRGFDKPTDVLSFPQEVFDPPHPMQLENTSRIEPQPDGSETIEHDDKPPKTLGDIVICLEVAQNNAKSIGQDLDREVAFLVVHGILHLVGYDHETKEEETQMRKAQKDLMNTLMSDDNQQPMWHMCVQPLASISKLEESI